MKIASYLASLLPSFGKDRVIEDCRLTRNEIVEFTHPAYHTAAPFFKGWKFKSALLENQSATFSRMVKTKGNIIETIEEGFKPILENLDQIEKLVAANYSEDVAGGGFTYLKANLLQLVECIAFVSKYARKFLIYVYVCETAEFPEGGTTLKDSLTPFEIEWINSNFITFCTAFSIVSGNPGNVKKLIEDIPDIVVTPENAGTLGATVGESKIDPFQMRLIPYWTNPIYHVGMFIAEWQADRYKAAKEELKLVQLRKLNLEKLEAKKPDAAVQKEITYMESRIQGINFKISQMEKKNA